MLTDKIEVIDNSCGNVSERILQRELVEKFLRKYFKINGNYTISDDGLVDVNSDVYLMYSKKFNKDGFKELPIQFGYVNGYFHFENSNIETMKGFPHTVDSFCSVKSSKNLKSLEYSPQCQSFYCDQCIGLESFDGLNCKRFIGNNLHLKRIGTNFTTKSFEFNNFQKPTADEMRRFIQLNPYFKTEQQAPWITLINDYFEHKDLFRAIGEFEALYNEPWVKPEDRIEMFQNENKDLSL